MNLLSLIYQLNNNKIKPNDLKSGQYNQVYELIIQAKSDDFSLSYVNNPELLSNEIYYKLCELSIKNDANSIIFVDSNLLSNSQYNDLHNIILNNKNINNMLYIFNCTKSPEKLTNNIIFNLLKISLINEEFNTDTINKNKNLLTSSQYNELIHVSNLYLNNKEEKLPIEYYYYLSKKLIYIDVNNIKDVDLNIINHKMYAQLCKIILNKNSNGNINILNIRHKDIISNKLYFKLCKFSLIDNLLNINYIDKTLLTDGQNKSLSKTINKCFNSEYFSINDIENPKEIDNKIYFELCIVSIMNKTKTVNDIDIDLLTKKQQLKLANLLYYSY